MQHLMQSSAANLFALIPWQHAKFGQRGEFYTKWNFSHREVMDLSEDETQMPNTDLSVYLQLENAAI